MTKPTEPSNEKKQPSDERIQPSNEVELLIAAGQALEALLLWEEMHPRSMAHAPRNKAIESLQSALAPYGIAKQAAKQHVRTYHD